MHSNRKKQDIVYIIIAVVVVGRIICSNAIS